MLKDQSLHFHSPGLADLSHSCFQAVLHVCVLERQAKSEKTEYLLDTPEASIGASSPTGTFLSCIFLVINHLQMLPQQHSCGRLSTSVWIPFLSVTKVRKKSCPGVLINPSKARTFTHVANLEGQASNLPLRSCSNAEYLSWNQRLGLLNLVSELGSVNVKWN